MSNELTVDQLRDLYRQHRWSAQSIVPALSNYDFECRVRETVSGFFLKRAKGTDPTPNEWVTGAGRVLDEIVAEHVTLKTFSGSYSASVKVTGSAPAVAAYVNRYMEKFHPAGYGTTAEEPIEDDENDTITVNIRRALSCD